MAHASDKSKRRGRSVPPETRPISRSPRGGASTSAGIPRDDFDDGSVKNSETSSINAWCDGSPGPGCSVDDLRWFVVREVGKMRHLASAAGRVAERQGIDVDILKAKMREKLDGDQVAVKVLQAIEGKANTADLG